MPLFQIVKAYKCNVAPQAVRVDHQKNNKKKTSQSHMRQSRGLLWTVDLCFACFSVFDMPEASIVTLSLPHFRRPAVDAFTAATDFQALNLQPLHARCILQPDVACHAASIGSFLGY